MNTNYQMNRVQFTDLDLKDFSFVWNTWICPLAKKLPIQMDAQFVKSVKFKVRDFSEIEPLARQYYLEKREAVKNEFYGAYASLGLHLMDFHKLSAVLCRTLIEFKIYSYDIALAEKYIRNEQIHSKDTNWLVHNALINYRFALHASIDFLYRSMLFRLDKRHSEVFDKLKAQGNLNLYKDNCSDNHESFENSLVLDLAKRDVNNRSFDCFLYSTIMFQLEEYNVQLLKSSV